jgi:hypothetical protein
MEKHPAVRSIVTIFQQAQSRCEAHRRLQPLVEALCDDRAFLFEAFRHCLSQPGALSRTTRLTLPLFESGDIAVALHLFAPLRDGARHIACDNIHHHGWRLLTTGVICGEYHFIDFLRRSHEDRSGEAVNLKVERIACHVKGRVRTVDSYTPHVVFRPDALCCTLAVWSADQILLNQAVKRRLAAFPRLRGLAVRSAHLARLDGMLGLNPTRGIYFRPEGGRIVEARNYKTPADGEPAEVLACILHLMQRLGFEDSAFLGRLADAAPPETAALIRRMRAGEEIPGAAVWGNWQQRFTKTQILQAIDSTYPKDSEPPEHPGAAPTAKRDSGCCGRTPSAALGR